MSIGRLKSWPLYLIPFLVIAMLFAGAYAATMVQVGASETKNRRLLDDMMTSIDLVERMDHDTDRMRYLTEEHIRETDPAAMARIDAQIAVLEDDCADAAASYTPLATLPGEAARWAQLQESIAKFESDIAAIAVPLQETLTLSRANRNVEAARTLPRLYERFAEIEDSVTALLEINRTQATRTLDAVQGIHHKAIRWVRNLALVGIVVASVVGVFTSRLLRRRQERLRRYSTDLERYSTALEEKNRELDAFAGRVAHDLRGPLNTLNLATTRLARRWPETAETTPTLQRAVERIDLLIEDLLSLSRMTTADANAACDPAAAAAQVQEDLVPRLQDADVAVRVDVRRANVRCSEALLRQVLWNLVENSVKYRRREVHTEVDIRGHPIDGRYELSVRDNGSGMSPDEARHAFDPLFRGESARAQAGTGLGLSIVKRVIEASGGTIAIDSHVGEGTTFSALLPIVEGLPTRREVSTTPSKRP